ncbi:hypothetical protein OG765_00835 [Streptomyces sp. NBC_00555]|uniref:hypothetical protein n=1 Tax=unclassified Streptomyces TaxID=2593676 RepID=UPI00214B6C07|nr:MULTISPECIES: hypothetical protein [unclassified Streptomyces]MCX5009547.1 hypothetical protein [Streptomyces sp. NBC_00555]UUU37920.1 hypothetical protein JIW86_02960 [Streptomyces sp. NBC_00162]
MTVQRHHVTVLAALGVLFLGGCSVTSEPRDTDGIPSALPAPDPHGAYATEDAVRAAQLQQWASINAETGPKAAVTHIKAVQVVQSGETQLVYLHTDLPHAEGGKPPEQTADLLAVYEAWPNRPATAVRIGAFDADGHRVGTAGIPAPTPPGT